MIGRLNHVAIVVPSVAAAAAVYRDTLGATVSAPQPLPAHGSRQISTRRMPCAIEAEQWRQVRQQVRRGVLRGASLVTA